MESIIFAGDAFSEYYIHNLLWDEPRLRPLLGLDEVDATYRRAAADALRGQRALRARRQARSTSTLLLGPLADILGWDLGEESQRVQTAEGLEDAGVALTVDDRVVARVLAIDPDAPLDLPATGVHRRFAPTLSMIRVLEEMDLTWGIIINGYELRLIRRAEGFVASHIGFDLTSIAGGTAVGLTAWRLLWATLRAEALAAEPMVLDRIVANGREHQAGVSDALGGQVRQAIISFLQGVVSHPANVDQLPQPLSDQTLNQLYAEVLRVLYRALFALYAESRNLLPLELPIYRDNYAITRLARQVTQPDTDPRRHPTPSDRFYEHGLRALFELLRQGANLGPEGRIPKYNGAMFDHTRTALIESLVWSDATVARVLECLTLVPTRAGQVRLSYRELDVEQLGAVYESLLEQVPQIAAEAMYRVLLDGRQLVINAEERQRLAERRSEVVADGVDDVVDDDDDDQDDDVDDQQQDDDGEADAAGDDEEETTPRTNRPLRVLEEIAPGTVYLKAGMGRKQTGSFYTSRPLVEFLVRRAIDPLAEGKTPEEILALRVLDPAMGSGHFLVGAMRRMGEHLLAAYRSRYEQALAAQPDLSPTDLFLEAGVHPEVARNWEHEERALTACRLLVAGNCIYGVDKNPLAVDLARVSLWLATAATDHPLTFLDHRLRCGDSLLGMPLYLGGDDEPEAHLLKTDAPPTTGRGRRRRADTDPVNAPLLEGLTAVEIVSDATRKLREKITRALNHLKLIRDLMDARPEDFAGHRAAFEAMQSELQWFTQLHALRLGRAFLPAETVADLGLINQWLADIARDGQPSDEHQQRAEPVIARGHEIGSFCWELAFPEVFFASDGTRKPDAGFDAIVGNPPWDKIKPNERELFSDFDPTVWDVQGQERKRLIRNLTNDNPDAKAAWERHESETRTLAKLLLEGGLYYHQIAEVEGKRTGGDPDVFKFFTERAYQLLRDGAIAALVLPDTLQASQGTTGLRRLLLDHCQVQALIRLTNTTSLTSGTNRIFPGVHPDKKFFAIALARGGRTEHIDAAFFGREIGNVLGGLRQHPRYLSLDASLYRELSPETYTFVELHDQREVDLLRRIYRQFPRLGEQREDTWNVSFTAEFHMTNDSYLFRDAARLRRFDAVLHSPHPPVTEAAIGAPYEQDEAGEFWMTPGSEHYEAAPDRFVQAERWVDSRGRVHPVGSLDENRIAYRMTGYVLAGEAGDVSALPIKPGEKYVPLYEGRMVHQFDHCQKAYIRGSGRRARWEELPWDQKRIVPHYVMAATDFDAMHPGRRIDRCGYCRVTGQTNERTLMASLMGGEGAVGEAVPTAAFSQADDRLGLGWIAVLNSFLIDYLIRLQVSNNINFFVMSSLPIPRFDPNDPELKPLLSGVTKLSCVTPETSGVWNRLAQAWPDKLPSPWLHNVACLDIHQRAKLRAEVDARVAMLYGLSAQEYARILSTFPLLDQDQPPLPGDCFIRQTNKGEKSKPRGFITRDLALLTFFELKGEAPPTDIVAFFADAGVDIERNTGKLRDLRVRVEEATKRGAVAYLPTQYRGWRADSTPYLPPDLPRPLIEDWAGHIGKYVMEDPSVNSGEATLKGTRIKAQMIHDMLMQGWTFAGVLESYPHLTAEQVAVALQWGNRG